MAFMRLPCPSQRALAAGGRCPAALVAPAFPGVGGSVVASFAASRGQWSLRMERKMVVGTTEADGGCEDGRCSRLDGAFAAVGA